MATANIQDTAQQYEQVMTQCRTIFIKKTTDYGTAWRVLRSISITDQIYIKAHRIRTIEEKKTQKISDDIREEFIGIINYGIIGNIQLSFPTDAPDDLDVDVAVRLYTEQVVAAKELMQTKNHDYGEAWRQMSQESYVDLILMKLLRIRQIITNDGQTLISEGIEANYFDIINYAVFALIRINEKELLAT